MEKIGLGADHGGYKLKEELKAYLKNFPELVVVDYGTLSEESVDYPQFGEKVAKAVARHEVDRGIVVCGTGIGITIAANKVKGIRAANCTSVLMAEMSRKHNNANVLGLGGRILDTELAKAITKTWLETPYEGGRHQKRLDQISALEC